MKILNNNFFRNNLCLVDLFFLIIFISTFSIGYAQQTLSVVESAKAGKKPEKVLSPLVPEEIADVYFPEGKSYILPEESRIARYVKKANQLESENNQRGAAKYYLMAYKKVKNTNMAPFLFFKYASLQSEINLICNILKELIEKYPDFSLINGVRFYLAEKLYLMGDYGGAKYYLNNIVNKEKDGEHIFTPFALRFLGILYLKDERWSEAEEIFKKSVSGIFDSGVTDYRYYLLKNYFGLSECYIAKKETNRAEKLLLTIYSTSDYDEIRVEALYRLFRMYEKTGKKDISSKVARLLIKDYPDSYYAHYIKRNYELGNEREILNVQHTFYDPSIFERDYIDKLEGKPVSRIEETESLTPRKNLKSGFMIQLGSFKDEKNARKLTEELKKMGYNPILINARIEEENIIRVRVGYYSSRSDAEKELNNLKSRGYPGFIVKE